ncbi:alcohol dehydrogenase catalytic domain-containing protein [Marinobacterium mangrovicola]|uniref:NADPH:quinone reductase-like Zn-dependent oxidoreductase n=1 Tax=Marinobacterium mangrovicola TaxID=1476959 RepID=A0A4R1GLP4_9GAMM|nr:alcohol dehydrogenase [Marinobacterium mangrovicola]TCK09188.1 NADPH:quinone reductase-like Zn-dependent oxidoreductase [Marinobacterium mangrovicola]
MAQLPQNYQAWSWQQSDDPSRLVLETLTPRALTEGEVWVRNQVIGLNPVDWKVLGSSGWQPGKIPGCDASGIVVALGPGVSADWLGKPVAYHQNLKGHGSFAELTPVRARALMALPDGLDLAVAASFPCPGLTAWQAINKVPAKAGEPLLIAGAGGAVGQYLVQLAARRGFAVTALCNSRHWQRLADLGAANCIETPYEALKDGRHFYAVIDAVNEASADSLVPALKANGHLVCIQGRLSQWPNAPFGQALSMHEVALGALHIFGDDNAWHGLTEAGQRLLGEIQAGNIQPESLHYSDFTDLPSALEALKNRTFSGKALVRVSGDQE